MSNDIDTSWNDSFDNQRTTKNSNPEDNLSTRDESIEKEFFTIQSELSELTEDINNQNWDKQNDDNSEIENIFSNPEIFSENDLNDIINNYINNQNLENDKNSGFIDKNDIESFDGIIPLEEEYLSQLDEQDFRDFVSSPEWKKIILEEINDSKVWKPESRHKPNRETLSLRLANWYKHHRYIRYRNIFEDFLDSDSDIEYESIKLIDKISKTISKLIKKGIDYTNNNVIIEELNPIINKIKEKPKLLALFQNSNENAIFIGILKEFIKWYADLARENLWDNKWKIRFPDNPEQKLRLETYLKFYELALYPEKLNDPNPQFDSLFTISIYLETEYPDIEFQNTYTNIKKIKEATERENERKKRRKEADQERKKKWAEKNRTINSHIEPAVKDNEAPDDNQEPTESNNLITTNWCDIATKQNLASKINDTNKTSKNEIILDNNEKTEIMDSTFHNSRKEFLANNEKLKDYINEHDMKKFFNQSFSINQLERKNFKDKRLNALKDKREIHQEERELNQIYNILITFPDTWNDKIIQYATIRKEEIDVDEKNHVLWMLIDNMKYFFDRIDNINIKENNLLIFGKLNNSNINMRYDLSSGKIFINSFIKESKNSIILWDNDPNNEVISIDSFTTILSNYQNEKNDPIWNNLNNWNHNDKEHKKLNDIIAAKLAPIWKDTQEHTKKEAIKIDVCNKLSKTFWLFDNANGNTIVLQQKIGVNNAFNIIQIINNSDETALSKFSKFMDQLCKYSWLKRWDTNLYPNDTTESSDWIKNINNIKPDSDNLKRIIDLSNAIKQFEKEKQDLTLNKDTSIWIVSIIQKYCIDEEQPYRKLNQNKMEEFINSIPLWISEIYDQQLLWQIQ